MARRALLLALLVATACTSSSKPPANSSSSGAPPGGATNTPVGPAAPIAATPGTSGGGTATPAPNPALPPPTGVSNGLRVDVAQGLFLLDPAMSGEPNFDGLVLVELAGAAPPAGTSVDLNGVPLVPHVEAGLPQKFWKIDPAGAQPVLDANGYLVATAKAGSLTRSLTLPCPGDVPVTSSVAPGSSLSAATSLQLAWNYDLSVNTVNPFPTDFFASAHLRGYDAATNTVATGLAVAQQAVPQHGLGAKLDVGATAASGYVAEVRWQGRFVQDGDSRGFCGRVKRLAYAK
jgi:hypothetical protein